MNKVSCSMHNGVLRVHMQLDGQAYERVMSHGVERLLGEALQEAMEQLAEKHVREVIGEKQ